MILNRKISLEDDDKLIEDTVVGLKLVGAKSVDTPRVKKNAGQTIQMKVRRRQRCIAARW